MYEVDNMIYGNNVIDRNSAKGNKVLVSIMNSDGYCERYKYDDNGRRTCIEDSDGTIWIYNYNNNGDLKEISCSDETTEFYDGGHIVKYVDSLTETVLLYEYDKDGNLIHTIEDGKVVVLRKYDENGNEIYRKDDMGEYSYTYDDQNRCIGYVHPFGSGSFKYDGNHIYKINPNGKISKTIEYNEDGNYIHIVSDNGVEQWREYDEDGNLIHIKNSSGYEYWATYKEI